MMASFEEVTAELISLLESGCEGISFVRSFPGDITEFPVKRPTVSVGISRAELPMGECFYLGADVDANDHYGAMASVDFRLQICVPKTGAGKEAYVAFDSIADACLGDTELHIISLGCGDINYNRIMGALVLDAEIKVRAALRSVSTD